MSRKRSNPPKILPAVNMFTKVRKRRRKNENIQPSMGLQQIRRHTSTKKQTPQPPKPPKPPHYPKWNPQKHKANVDPSKIVKPTGHKYKPSGNKLPPPPKPKPKPKPAPWQPSFIPVEEKGGEPGYNPPPPPPPTPPKPKKKAKKWIPNKDPNRHSTVKLNPDWIAENPEEYKQWQMDKEVEQHYQEEQWKQEHEPSIWKEAWWTISPWLPYKHF
jgi:hypothetical protein